MTEHITRRRAIRISGAAAGLSLLPFGQHRAANATFVSWRGTALGAVATMQLCHSDRAFAERLIERSIVEVRRLERLFSLYREDSELVALNKYGALASPSPELVELLLEAQRYSALTGGVFDVTVQPLWNLYAEYFSRPDASPTGPPADVITAALSRVSHAALLVNQDRIAFAKAGMSVTLNGIAQGYMTDRVVDLLQAEGISQTLVDMGETRCLGTHPSGRPWEVGIADPERPDHIKQTISAVNQAVATSGGYGFQFDKAGTFNHLFDPKTGRSPHASQSITIVAPTATCADALSTAFSLMELPDIERVLSKIEGTVTHLLLGNVRVVQLSSNPETLPTARL